MKTLFTFCLIISQCFLFSSCGEGNESVVMTIIATSGAESQGISSLIYLDGSGVEQSSNIVGVKSTFTQTVIAKDGDLIFLTACANITGPLSTVTVRLLNNGRLVATSSATGTQFQPGTPEDPGPPVIPATPDIPATKACASVEGFADVEDPDESGETEDSENTTDAGAEG